MNAGCVSRGPHRLAEVPPPRSRRFSRPPAPRSASGPLPSRPSRSPAAPMRMSTGRTRQEAVNDRARQPRRYGRQPELHPQRHYFPQGRGGRRRAHLLGELQRRRKLDWACRISTARNVEQKFIEFLPNLGVGVAVDANYIYWALGTSRALSAAPPSTVTRTASSRTSSPRQALPNGVAVDGGHVYWANGLFSQHDRARRPRRLEPRPGLPRPRLPAPGVWRSTRTTSTGRTLRHPHTIGRANVDGSESRPELHQRRRRPPGGGGRQRPCVLGERLRLNNTIGRAELPEGPGGPTNIDPSLITLSSGTPNRGRGRRADRLLRRPGGDGRRHGPPRQAQGHEWRRRDRRRRRSRHRRRAGGRRSRLRRRGRRRDPGQGRRRQAPEAGAARTSRGAEPATTSWWAEPATTCTGAAAARTSVAAEAARTASGAAERGPVWPRAKCCHGALTPARLSGRARHPSKPPSCRSRGVISAAWATNPIPGRPRRPPPSVGSWHANGAA